MKQLYYFVGITIFSILSCGTPTSLVETWTSEDYTKGGIEKILVIGIHENQSVRNLFERTLQSKLSKRGIEVLRSLEKIPHDTLVTRDAYYKYFSDQNINAVVVSRVVNIKRLADFVEGDSYYVAHNSYHSMYDYYNLSYVQERGHFEFGNEVRIETNLFETKEATLVWNCISDVFHTDNTEEVVAGLAGLISTELMKGGFLK
jgi:hypothetical protein